MAFALGFIRPVNSKARGPRRWGGADRPQPLSLLPPRALQPSCVGRQGPVHMLLFTPCCIPHPQLSQISVELSAPPAKGTPKEGGKEKEAEEAAARELLRK